MARGFLSGALWGVVVAGLGTGAASVVNGPVFAPRPEVADAVAGEPSSPEADVGEAAPQGAVRDTVSPQTPSPGIPEPEAGDTSADGVADTASTGLPETGEAGALSAAPEGDEGTGLSASLSDAVLPNPQAMAPSAPAEDDLSISTNPEQPAAPRPSVDEAAPQLSGTAPEVDTVVDAPQVDTPVGIDPAVATPALADGPVQPESPPESSDAPPPVVVIAQAPVESGGAEGAVAADDAGTGASAATDTTPGRAAPETPDSTEVGSAPTAETEAPAPPELPRVSSLTDKTDRTAGRPGIGKPAGTLTDRAEDLRTGRLPSVTDSTTAEDPPRPIDQYAQAIEIEADKPMMSIILVDDGSTPLGLEALESFPYPITFALDTAWTGAAEAMNTYRAAGFEVMALTNLPPGARPQDAEVTLATAMSTIPEAVAVLEGDGGGLQESRAVSDQVARILAQSGHGLVMYPKGLNTAQALAARAGVPSATLFRDFDSNGQSATVIRRFLDQAAFKAGQEGAVIMLGRLRPETISALLIWGLQDRANRVGLVPVSKILLFDEADS